MEAGGSRLRRRHPHGPLHRLRAEAGPQGQGNGEFCLVAVDHIRHHQQGNVMGVGFHVPILDLPQALCPGDPQDGARQAAVVRRQPGVRRRPGDDRVLLQERPGHLHHLSHLLLQTHGAEKISQILFSHVITTSFTPFLRAISRSSSIRASFGSGVEAKDSRTPYFRNLISL